VKLFETEKPSAISRLSGPMLEILPNETSGIETLVFCPEAGVCLLPNNTLLDLDQSERMHMLVTKHLWRNLSLHHISLGHSTIRMSQRWNPMRMVLPLRLGLNM
jgi:hypothetical protein